MPKLETNIVGKKFNYLTITEDLHVVGSGESRRVVAICDCGNVGEFYYNNIKKGHTKSCGCHKEKIVRSVNVTHGMSGKHPLYRVWDTMKHRCYNPNNKRYDSYGGRGVRVCDEWKDDFMTFYNWAIENRWKKGMQIDKDIKSNGLLYSPLTCSVVTVTENQNNRRDNVIIEYNGDKYTISQLARKLNLKYAPFWNRIVKLGWSVDDAIKRPLRFSGMIIQE